MGRRTLAPPDTKPTEFHGIITASPEMAEFFEKLKRVARTDSTVLIRGESGTGKELVAKALHDLSPRAARPFHAINCATLTPELLASELFGHVRGAFTGAVRDRKGLFAAADHGTVFLDEIAELPLDLQARLLRVLQERSFIPVGATDPVTVDVRILSATNRSLREEVEQRRFREDLMYRVRVVPLFLPRLAERQGDIEALTWHFIAAFNLQGYRTIDAIDADVMRALKDYPWPGNIRELRNVVEYAFAIGDGPTLTLDDLTPELRGEPPPNETHPWADQSAEREAILNALRQTRGHRGKAAEALGVSRSTLWRRIRELHINEL